MMISKIDIVETKYDLIIANLLTVATVPFHYGSDCNIKNNIICFQLVFGLNAVFLALFEDDDAAKKANYIQNRFKMQFFALDKRKPYSAFYEDAVQLIQSLCSRCSVHHLCSNLSHFRNGTTLCDIASFERSMSQEHGVIVKSPDDISNIEAQNGYSVTY